MSIVIFAMAELLGVIALFATWKGVFSLVTAFMFVVVMLALSFHVMARQPRPDGTSIRMGSVAAVLWYCAILSTTLMFEHRGMLVTFIAGLIATIVAGVAGTATYAVVRRPPDLDVE